jgi:hemerythrin-like domain-containing protein
MKATAELGAEHKAVLVALRILERVAGAAAEKNGSALDHLGQLLDFFKGFVDRCHHAKEEEVLFPELVRRGLKREGGPIGVLLSEHETGRGHVRAMAEALPNLRHGDSGAAANLRGHSDAFRELLRAHIQKENDVLFPMADRLVPEDVAGRMAGQFETIERERVGEGKHEAYHAMLHDLKEQYGI